MVNPSWPATSCIHTKDSAVKTVADLQPQLKGCETHLTSLIFHQNNPLKECHYFFLLKNITQLTFY